MEELGIADLSQGTNDLRMLVKGEDVKGDMADHNVLKMLWVDLPPLEGEVQIKEAIKVPTSQS